MSLRRGLLLIAALSLLFLLANRAAYKGFFSDDDLDNLVQTRGAEASFFAAQLASPQLSAWNFRPVGHSFYKALGATAGLHFPPYIAALHLLHLLNAVLVWLLLRRLGAGPLAAAAGAAFFAFHMACFDAYWKPMFVFDVACATFLLLALLAYLHGRWLLALIPFWLAYKTKETAIALPAFLFLYEWLLGSRQWKRLLPFLAMSLNFGLQAVFANRGAETPYTLRFTPAAVWTTLSFYSSRVLLIPYAGLLLIPAAWLSRDRRIRFGVAAAAVLLGPLWFLPGRLFAVYLYVPLIGLAVAFAFAAERLKPACIAAFFLLWIPANYLLLRQHRGVALAAAEENRAYVTQAGQALAAHPDWRDIVYDGAPASLQPWGVRAAFAWFRPGSEMRVQSADSPEGRAMLAAPEVQTASWNPARRRLNFQARLPGSPEPAYADISAGNPAWLFLQGWHSVEAGYRWMHPEASLRLHRPASAREFEVRINFGPIQFKDQGQIALEVLLDGRSLGVRYYRQEGWHAQRWPLPPGPAGPARITLRTLQPYRPSNGDPRPLGAAIAALGFVE